MAVQCKDVGGVDFVTAASRASLPGWRRACTAVMRSPSSSIQLAEINVSPCQPSSAGVPVVYKLNMKEPVGFFAAQRFVMRDNDMLYVSNSASADLSKLFSVFSGGLSSANAATSLQARVAAGGL